VTRKVNYTRILKISYFTLWPLNASVYNVFIIHTRLLPPYINLNIPSMQGYGTYYVENTVFIVTYKTNTKMNPVINIHVVWQWRALALDPEKRFTWFCQQWILPVTYFFFLFIHRRGLSANLIHPYLYTVSGNTNICVTQCILSRQWTQEITQSKLF
jgi:hypothetical protein